MVGWLAWNGLSLLNMVSQVLQVFPTQYCTVLRLFYAWFYSTSLFFLCQKLSMRTEPLLQPRTSTLHSGYHTEVTLITVLVFTQTREGSFFKGQGIRIMESIKVGDPFNKVKACPCFEVGWQCLVSWVIFGCFLVFCLLWIDPVVRGYDPLGLVWLLVFFVCFFVGQEKRTESLYKQRYSDSVSRKGPDFLFFPWLLWRWLCISREGFPMVCLYVFAWSFFLVSRFYFYFLWPGFGCLTYFCCC